MDIYSNKNFKGKREINNKKTTKFIQKSLFYFEELFDSQHFTLKKKIKSIIIKKKKKTKIQKLKMIKKLIKKHSKKKSIIKI